MARWQSRKVWELLDRSGFTLIELLIVVAIIGILALVAIPNFNEARVRSKVAAVYSDARTIHQALDQYRVEQGQYPPSNYVLSWDQKALKRLSTPIAYLSTIPRDRFRPAIDPQTKRVTEKRDLDYSYYACYETTEYFGPAETGSSATDKAGYGDDNYFVPFDTFLISVGPDRFIQWRFYDPTNGAMSAGDIYRMSYVAEKSGQQYGFRKIQH